MEHSGTLPPVLGALDEHERFESRVRRSVIHGYRGLKSEAPERAKQFRELVKHLHATSYAAQLAQPAIFEVSGEPITKDIGNFAMLFLGQGMRILGLALMMFVLLAFFIRC
jgi:hypothetical protein